MKSKVNGDWKNVISWMFVDDKFFYLHGISDFKTTELSGQW